MYNNCLGIIRAKVAFDVWSGVATDVYKLASELHREHPSYSEHDLIQMISKIAAEFKGGAALWENPGNEATR